jgi:MoxR-like ATPase
MTNSTEDDALAAIDDLTYEQLACEAETIRQRLDRFRSALSRFFVGKQQQIDLMTICALAQEPLLLVGAPGTAKSDLVLKFKDALGLSEGDYFEYTLTRFTEPSEVIGPIDINLLREGRYLRRCSGKLPEARLVFLDEIFNSNSAILNTLLTIINERKFYQDGAAAPVRLRILFAATNEIPRHTELGALKDRFSLKIACRSVQDEYFEQLLDLGLQAQVHRNLGQRPWAEGHATLADLLKAHRYLTLQFAQEDVGPDGELRRDRHRHLDRALLLELRRLIKTLVREHQLFISDRKLVKLYKLMRCRAWLFHGGVIEKDDLVLLSYLGETSEEIDLLEVQVPRLLGIG